MDIGFTWFSKVSKISNCLDLEFIKNSPKAEKDPILGVHKRFAKL